MAIRAGNLEVNDGGPVFQQIYYNAFFLHTKNVWLSMIADENSIIQKLGWRRLKNLNIKWPGLAAAQVLDVLILSRLFSMIIQFIMPLIGLFDKMRTTAT